MPRSRGRVDFSGAITGSGAVQIGGPGGVAYTGGTSSSGLNLGNVGGGFAGNGTIAFTASTGLTGPTTVASGRLLVNGSLYASSSSSVTSTVTVGTTGPATLGGTGVIYGNVNMNNNTTIEAGMSVGSPLVLANGLQINDGGGNDNVVFQFDSLGAPGNPGIKIQNSSGLPGFNSSTDGIVITGAISGASTYALMSVDPSDSGTLANLLPNGTYGQLGYGFSLSQSLPNRANGSLQVNGTELDLVVSELYSVAWTGLNTSSWNAYNNFQQMGGVDQFDKFEPGDAVVFSDSAAGFILNVNAGNVAHQQHDVPEHLACLYDYRDRLHHRQHGPEPDQQRHGHYRKHGHLLGADLDRAGVDAAIGQRHQRHGRPVDGLADFGQRRADL